MNIYFSLLGKSAGAKKAGQRLQKFKGRITKKNQAFGGTVSLAKLVAVKIVDARGIESLKLYGFDMLANRIANSKPSNSMGLAIADSP
jgi:hypothetical protein